MGRIDKPRGECFMSVELKRGSVCVDKNVTDMVGESLGGYIYDRSCQLAMTEPPLLDDRPRTGTPVF